MLRHFNLILNIPMVSSMITSTVRTKIFIQKGYKIFEIMDVSRGGK